MHSKGFALLEILIAVTVVALLVTGGFYWGSTGGDEGESALEAGIDAKQQAQEVAEQFSARNQDASDRIRDLNDTLGKPEQKIPAAPPASPAPNPKPAPVPTPIPVPMPTPAPTQVVTTIPIPPAFVQKPSCITNTSPIFIAHITDMSKGSYVVAPPTMGSGPSLKPHGYIGTNGARVPVYAPVAMTVKAGSHYVGGPYMFEFQISCEVTLRFGHITDPVDALKKLLPAEPKEDSRTQELSGVSFVAGELIGYTIGTSMAGNWDFGVYNAMVRNRYADDPDWNNSSVYTTAVCPFDYFTSDLKAAYTVKFNSTILGGNPPDGESFC